MKKSIYWIIWTLVFIVINIEALLIANFSLFGTAAGTSIFSLDYLIAFAIIVLPNIISIQLFISSRKQDQTNFLFGLVIAIIQMCSFVIIFNKIGITLVAISIVAAAILLIKSIIR